MTVSDSGVGAAAQSTSVDFAVTERPRTTAPGGTDPLLGLRINEVRATGSPADDWVEIINTGAAVAGASMNLVDEDGDVHHVPTQDVAAGDHVVIEGSDLDASGLDLAASDTLDLTAPDDTVLDETSWSSHPSTSWARYPDGTGDFGVSQHATKAAATHFPRR